MSALPRGVAPVGFLEDPARPLAVGRLLGKFLRVPFTTPGGKEIAAVNVDRGSEFGCRVGDRVDNVFAERLRVFRAQRASPGSFELRFPDRCDTTPEDVVLAPTVDADNRPHMMIVRHDHHARAHTTLRMPRSDAR